MSGIGLKYLDFHMTNTFKELSSLRHLLHVDWFEDCGIRAALYMSKKNSHRILFFFLGHYLYYIIN